MEINPIKTNQISNHHLKKVTLKEKLCYLICRIKNKKVSIYEKYKKIISKSLSIDSILQSMNELEKLKIILFNQDELETFENMRNFTLEEYEARIRRKEQIRENPSNDFLTEYKRKMINFT